MKSQLAPSLLVASILTVSPALAQGDLISHGLASDDSSQQYQAVQRLRREWSAWDSKLRDEKVAELARLAAKPKANAWGIWTLGDLAAEGDSLAGGALLELLSEAKTPFQVRNVCGAIARADSETRSAARAHLVGRLPKELTTQADVEVLVQLAFLGWSPEKVEARFLRALERTPQERFHQVAGGIRHVWSKPNPPSGTKVARKLLSIARGKGGRGQRMLATHAIGAFGPTAAPLRQKLLTLLPEFGNGVAQVVAGMGPAAEDAHAEVLAAWKSGSGNLRWDSVFRLAPDDPRVVAGQEAVFEAGPKSPRWRIAVEALALRKDPHAAFEKLCGELLEGDLIWQTSHALKVYSTRSDWSKAMRRLYWTAMRTSKHKMVQRTATEALGHSPSKASARILLTGALEEDSPPGLHTVAASALAQLDGEKAYPVLRKALDSPKTVLAATQALGLLGAKAQGARAALKEIVAGAKIEGVDLISARRFARQALRRIEADDPTLP